MKSILLFVLLLLFNEGACSPVLTKKLRNPQPELETNTLPPYSVNVDSTTTTMSTTTTTATSTVVASSVPVSALASMDKRQGSMIRAMMEDMPGKGANGITFSIFFKVHTN